MRPMLLLGLAVALLAGVGLLFVRNRRKEQ